MSWPSDPAKQAAIGRTSDEQPYVWLFDVEIPTDPPTRVRITTAGEPVEYEFASDGSPLVWQPYPFTVESIRENTESDLPSIRVAVSNIAREVQALIEEYDGLIGQPCRLRLVHLGTLAAGAYIIYRGEVISLTADEQVIGFEMGSYSLQRQLMPSQRALRDYCRFKYKGNRCGYTGALPSCDKTLNGPNGCVVHDNEERFGGFPSMPKPGNV